MGLFSKAHLTAEIAKIVAETYALLKDKSRETYERDQKIKDLERQVEELKERMDEK